MPQRSAAPDPGWIRALGYATDAPGADEALSGVLAEAVAATDALAGAVVARGESCPTAAYPVGPDEIRPLLASAGAAREMLQQPEEWVDRVVELARGEDEAPWPLDASRLLLWPLRVRGLPVGALLLLYAGAPPSEGARELVWGYAGVAALVLEHERLYEEARSALQARAHFLTALNHELRTPAHVLLLHADLLRSDSHPLPPAVARGLAETETAVYQMIDVLRKVLDLGSIGDQAHPEQLDILQPRQAVADLLRRVEPAAQRKGLTLSLFVPRGLPPLQTDVGRFSRILLHLFSNAIKYTAEGGVEVRLERTVRTLSRHRQEPALVVRVSDSGCGIPPAELARILEPFAQVDEGSRTDSRTRGLGLGLPLARQLARTLGGEITVDSTPGRGTTAVFTVPYRAPG